MWVKKVLKYGGLFLAMWFVLHAIIIVVDGLRDEVGPADAILIFGNKVEESGVPSARLQSRLDKGVELFSEGQAPLIIVSGGFGKEGYEEAEVMKQYLVAQKIPVSAIVEDKKGYDTYQTAHNVAVLAKDRNINKVIIVSQYYHITRAKLALSKFGFVAPYAAHADIFELRDLYSIPREVVGYYVYLFKDYK